MSALDLFFAAGIRLIQSAGAALTGRPVLNFTAGGVSDDPVNNRTNVTVNGLGNITVTGTPTTGQVLTATGPTTAAWGSSVPIPLWSYDFRNIGIGPQATLPTDPIAGTIQLLRACANTTADPLATVRVDEGEVITGIGANIARIGQAGASSATRGLVIDHASSNNGPVSVGPGATGSGSIWAFTPGTGTSTVGSQAPDGSATAALLTVPDASSYNAFWLESNMQSASIWSFHYANGVATGSGNQNLFINLNAAGTEVKPYDLPPFNATPIWHRFEQYVSGASALTFDQRTAPAVVPVSVYVWGFQVEPGQVPTEYIPNANTTYPGSASRQGEEILIPNGAACFPGGRLNLHIQWCPKASISAYALPRRLWADPNDATTYIEVTAALKLNVVVHGSAWLSPIVLSWQKNQLLDFMISFGAGQSSATYAANGQPLVSLGNSGSTNYAAITPSGGMNINGYGTTLQMTARVQMIEGYPSNDAPFMHAVLDSPQIYNCAMDGDSITAAFGLLNPATQGYVGQLEAALGEKFGKLINKGISGQTLGGTPGMISLAPTYIDPLYGSWPRNICSCWGGTNDLANGSVSAASVYASYTTYVQARQAAGWKVIVWTVMDRNAGSTPQATFDTNRATFNALVLANAAGADGVVDLTGQALLNAVGAKNNATYFQSGGIHPTAAGCALIVPLAAPIFLATAA